MAEHTTEAGSGGSGDGGGSGSGELYGDLWIVARDLDPSDGGGNGEPILDGNGQIVPIGRDPDTGELFPIHLVDGGEGEYEVPAELEPYVQEIELERANMMRSPDQVTEHALEEALGKIEAGSEITAEASGRLMVDGVLIDSPRENLALYELIMKAGGAASWTEAQANASAELPPALADLLDSGWNPTGLLAGVFSKFAPVSLDAVITAHTLMGVNEVDDSGETLRIDHFGFTQGGTESFDYDRVETYGDVWVQWYQDMDGDPSDLEAVQRTLLDAIWGRDRNGDGVNDPGTGVGWRDEYLKLSEDGLSLEAAAGGSAGINDWAQSVEDARQAIYLLHEFVGASEIERPAGEDRVIEGSSYADYLATWDGDDALLGRQGDDVLEGGDGDDLLRGGSGNDALTGGRGADTLRGGDGDDVVNRGGGDDRIFGGDGDDVLGGGHGRDAISGDDGDDLLRGHRRADALDGGAGDDGLRGGRGADALTGGAGDDKLIGNRGDDVLDGGDGDDRLIGGRGDDALTGGAGADVFVFRAATGDEDLIVDFSAEEMDVIRLAPIDADAGTAADDAFAFLGYAEFSGAAGELRAVDLGDAQRIEGDVDGDGAADFAIEIAGDAPAEEGWFVL